jgi:hypothetical protein
MRQLISPLFLLVALATQPAAWAQAAEGVEQQLAAMQGDKRGVTLYVSGQQIGGAVVKLEPGKFVELRGPAGQRIVVRLERIDAVAWY